MELEQRALVNQYHVKSIPTEGVQARLETPEPRPVQARHAAYRFGAWLCPAYAFGEGSTQVGKHVGTTSEAIFGSEGRFRILPHPSLLFSLDHSPHDESSCISNSTILKIQFLLVDDLLLS